MSNFPDKIQNLPLLNGHFHAKKLEAKAATILFASYHKGMTISAHNHDTENYGIVTKGTMILNMSGKEQEYTVGEWYYIPAFLIHSAYFPIDTETIEFWFSQEETLTKKKK